MTVGFHVQDFTQIDDIGMTFTVRMKLYLKWNDDKIQLETFSDGEEQRVIAADALGEREQVYERAWSWEGVK